MTGAVYTRSFQVAWSDLDANVHLRNTAYLDYASQTRFLYLQERGFTPADFRTAGIGPVAFSERITYHRELHFLEAFDVTLELGGLSEDGAKFMMLNRFLKQDGRVAAEVASHGAWVDLAARKVSAPPDALLAALRGLRRADGFETL